MLWIAFWFCCVQTCHMMNVDVLMTMSLMETEMTWLVCHRRFPWGEKSLHESVVELVLVQCDHLLTHHFRLISMKNVFFTLCKLFSLQLKLKSIILVVLTDVTVHYIRGLPNVVCPLPSRNEKCQFILRPVSHNVGDFIDMLKSEDRGIDRAAILNKDGVRIASSCSIENLMDEQFWWVLFR